MQPGSSPRTDTPRALTGGIGGPTGARCPRRRSWRCGGRRRQSACSRWGPRAPASPPGRRLSRHPTACWVGSRAAGGRVFGGALTLLHCHARHCCGLQAAVGPAASSSGAPDAAVVLHVGAAAGGQGVALQLGAADVVAVPPQLLESALPRAPARLHLCTARAVAGNMNAASPRCKQGHPPWSGHRPSCAHGHFNIGEQPLACSLLVALAPDGTGGGRQA